MKKYADRNRIDRQFQEGDMVYLKMQPYRLAAFNIRSGLKLATKFYGPYRILQKIGNSSYKLQLPARVQIHNVFHFSQLKRHLGPNAVPDPDLPLVDATGKVNSPHLGAGNKSCTQTTSFGHTMASPVAEHVA